MKWIKKSVACLLFLQFIPGYFLWCQVLQSQLPSASAGMGVFSQRHVDLFAFPLNAAALAGIKEHSAGLSGERLYMLPGLNHYTMLGCIETSSGNFGIDLHVGNYSLSSEFQFSLAYGRKISSRADIGGQLSYFSTSYPGYGGKQHFSMGAGFIFHFTEKMHAGISLQYPAPGQRKKTASADPVTGYIAGLGWDASEKFLLSIIYCKTEKRAANLLAGINYSFLPGMGARFGISTSTSSPLLAYFITLQNMKLELGTSMHPQLGFSPRLQLVYSFRKEEK